MTAVPFGGVVEAAGVGVPLPTLELVLTRHATCVATGLPPVPAAEPLSPELNPAAHYLASLPSRDSRVSQASSLRVVARMFGHTLEAMPWHCLGPAHTARLRALLAERYAPATANRYLTAVRETLRAARRLGLLTPEALEGAIGFKNVKGSRLAPGRELPQAEIRRLFAAARSDTRRRRGSRAAAIVALLFGAGLRVHEVARLELPGCYDGERIRVVGKGNKEREVVLPAGARRAIDAWLEVRGRGPGPLIDSLEEPGRRMSPEAVADALARLAKRAKVENVHTHDGRRTVATYLLDVAGVKPQVVQGILGHASIEQTMRYRRGESRRAQEEAAELLPVPFG